ncbi:MAG: hypothetical protein ACLS69_09070 [Butyricicoccus sp.]
MHQTALKLTGQNVGGGNTTSRKAYASVCSMCGVGIVLSKCAYLFRHRTAFHITLTGGYPVRSGAHAFVCLPYFLCGIMDTPIGLCAACIPLCRDRLAHRMRAADCLDYDLPDGPHADVVFSVSGLVASALAHFICYLIVHRRFMKKHTLEPQP